MNCGWLWVTLSLGAKYSCFLFNDSTDISPSFLSVCMLYSNALLIMDASKTVWREGPYKRSAHQTLNPFQDQFLCLQHVY